MKYLISGIGCRFPGNGYIYHLNYRNDVNSFWDELCRGDCCIRDVPKDRWDSNMYSSDGNTMEGKSITRKGGFLDSIDTFDITFFNISPKQASCMDPQQRVVLEVVYEALCDSRIKISDIKGTNTGVFVGAGAVESLGFQFYYPEYINSFSLESNTLGNIANRVSYFFDLKGPSFSVDTACSSAMTALHMAIRSLDAGDCKTAIVVGVNMMLGVAPFVCFSQAKMLSPTGTSRPFDEKANGFVRSEGCGVIILQKTDDISPIQRIYGSIVGCGINEDGKTKSLTMPSAEQQAQLILDTYKRNNLDMKNVVYVEAHGTGTGVGDPLEAKSIGETIGKVHDGKVVIGSVKGNIGHMETAAAMGGLIKAVLMLYNKQHVKTVGHDVLNPKIDSEKLNIKIQTQNEPLNVTENSLIGVSSYGFGGANGHCVIAPVEEKSEFDGKYDYLILPLSSHYKDGIDLTLDSWKKTIKPELLPEACALQSLTHNPLRFRRALVGPNNQDFLTKAKVFKGDIGYKDKPRVAFVFGGQGSQYKDMCKFCYKYFPVFRDACEEADSYFKQFGGTSILHDVGLFQDNDVSPATLSKVEVSLPSIVMSQIGLVTLYRSFGIEPSVVLGHSTGEMIAAWALGALTTKDLCCLASERAKGQANMALGAMAALGMGEEDGQKLINTLHLEELVEVACINSPNSITISGDKDAIIKIGKYCEENKLYFVLLPINHAYHSHYCESMRELVFGSAPYFEVHPTNGTFVSAALQKVETGLLDVDYWWKNIRGAVHFQQGLEIIQDYCDIILEIDSHSILRNYCLSVLPDMPYVSSLRKGHDDVEQILYSLASLYCLGVNDIKWDAFYQIPIHSKISLPNITWDHSHIYRMGAWKEDLEKEDHIQRRLHNNNNKSTIIPTISEESKHSFSEFNIIKLHKEEYAYVEDHKVSDGIVLPGAMYVSIGIELEPENNDIIIIKNSNFKRFLVWSQDRDILDISINYQNNYYSISSDGIEYMNGMRITKKQQYYQMIQPISNDKIDILRNRCKTSIDVQSLYRCLSRFSGIEFGKKFQLIKSMYTGDDESITEMNPCYDTTRRIHPTVIDSWIQSFAFSMGLPSDPLVPVSCDEIHFFKQNLQPCIYMCYNKIQESNMESVKGDIDVFTQDGNRIASIRGLYMKYIFRSRPQDFKFNQLQYISEKSPIGDKFNNTKYQNISEIIEKIKNILLNNINRVFRIADNSYNGVFASQIIPVLNSNEIKIPFVQISSNHLNSDIIIKNKRIHLYYGSILDDSDNNEMFDIIYDPKQSTSIEKCIENGIMITSSEINVYHKQISSIKNKNIVVLGKENILTKSDKIIINPENEKQLLNCEYIIDSRQSIVKCSELLNILITKSISGNNIPTLLVIYDKLHCEMVGFSRTARNENPNIIIKTLEVNNFENIENSINEVLSNNYEHEFEYRLDENNEMTIPRLLEYVYPTNDSFVSKEYRIEIDRPGQVDTLTRHAIDINNECLNDDEVRIRVCATAMHFKDIMLAMNLLPGFRPIFGIECSGTIMELGSNMIKENEFHIGDKVLCVSMDTGSSHESRNSMLSTTCICKKYNIIKAPSNIDLTIASGFLGVMVTAYYSLIKLANITKDDIVLIHSAMGGVGLCAIQLCKMIGCKIIASAGNDDKRNQLLNDLKVDYVIDSHNPDTFVENIMKYTNGKGVNVALNSIAGAGQIETLKCLSPLGRFIEIGKRDIMNNSQLNENLLKNNISFFSAHIDLLAETHPEKLHVYLQECIDLLNDNKLHPIPTKVYPLSEIQSVFKMMMKGTHTGKIVISIPNPNESNTITKPSNTLFSSNKTYLFTGSTRGVGLNIAMWAVSHGARHIYLTGGSGKLSKKTESMINKIKNDYPNVDIKIGTLDVRQVEIVEEFVNKCEPKLGGIFHFATQYNSGLSNKITEKDCLQGMDVKVRGAWNLHNATKNMNLDYFITASSISGVYGNTMQAIYAAANCALVGLARYRRTIGLNSLSIDLPMVLGCGRLSDLPYLYELELNGNKGFTTGSIHDITNMLEMLLVTKTYPPNVTLDCVPWNKVCEINRNINEFIYGINSDISLFHEEIDDEEYSINYISNSALEMNVISKLAYILGCKVSDIDPSKELSRLGIDSIGAMQLMNWVNLEYQCNITAVDLLNPNNTLLDLFAIITSQRTTIVDSYEDDNEETNITDLKYNYDVIYNALVRKLSFFIGSNADNIKPDNTLGSVGTDSLTVIQLRNWLNSKYNLNITPSSFNEKNTLNDIVEFIINNVVQTPHQTPRSPSNENVTVDNSQIIKILSDKLASIIGSDSNDIDIEKPLTDMGVDSLSAVQLMNWLNNEYHINISQNQLLSGMNLNSIIKMVTSTQKPSNIPNKRIVKQVKQIVPSQPKQITRPTQNTIKSTPIQDSSDKILSELIDKVAYIIGSEANDLDRDKPLTDMGIDSLSAVQLMNWLNNEFHINISQNQILSGMNINNILNNIATSFNAGRKQAIMSKIQPQPTKIIQQKPQSVQRQPKQIQQIQNTNNSNIKEDVINKLASIIGSDSNDIDIEKPLTDMGVDSLSAVQLMNWLNNEYHINISQNQILSGINVQSIINQISKSNNSNQIKQKPIQMIKQTPQLIQRQPKQIQQKQIQPKQNQQIQNTNNSNIKEDVINKLASIIGSDSNDIDIEKPLTDMGVDSLSAVQLMNWLNNEYHINISQNQLLSGMNLSSILSKITVVPTKTSPKQSSPRKIQESSYSTQPIVTQGISDAQYINIRYNELSVNMISSIIEELDYNRVVIFNIEVEEFCLSNDLTNNQMILSIQKLYNNIKCINHPSICVCHGVIKGLGLLIPCLCELVICGNNNVRFEYENIINPTLKSLLNKTMQLKMSSQLVKRITLLNHELNVNDALSFGFIDEICNEQSIQETVTIMSDNIISLYN